MIIWGTGPAPHGSRAAVTCPQTTGLAGASGSWAWDGRRGSGEDTWLQHPTSPITPPQGFRGCGQRGCRPPLRGVLPLSAPPTQGAIQSVPVPRNDFSC